MIIVAHQSDVKNVALASWNHELSRLSFDMVERMSGSSSHPGQLSKPRGRLKSNLGLEALLLKLAVGPTKGCCSNTTRADRQQKRRRRAEDLPKPRGLFGLPLRGSHSFVLAAPLICDHPRSTRLGYVHPITSPL